jgi:protein required for attachment to host cells
MTRIRVPWMSWVLVCDGAKAIIFRNQGDQELLNLETVETLSEPHPQARELGADRPGRVHESVGQSRSAVSEPDPHERAEAAFLERIVARLEEILRDQPKRELIVVAPPRELGLLRKALTPALRDCVIAELGKDLAHMTTPEIERHLGEAQRASA